MVDLTSCELTSHYSVDQQPGEGIFDTWLRALDAAPPGHCGPIYIR